MIEIRIETSPSGLPKQPIAVTIIFVTDGPEVDHVSHFVIGKTAWIALGSLIYFGAGQLGPPDSLMTETEYEFVNVRAPKLGSQLAAGAIGGLRFVKKLTFRLHHTIVEDSPPST